MYVHCTLHHVKYRRPQYTAADVVLRQCEKVNGKSVSMLYAYHVKYTMHFGANMCWCLSHFLIHMRYTCAFFSTTKNLTLYFLHFTQTNVDLPSNILSGYCTLICMHSVQSGKRAAVAAVAARILFTFVGPFEICNVALVFLNVQCIVQIAK